MVLPAPWTLLSACAILAFLPPAHPAASATPRQSPGCSPPSKCVPLSRCPAAIRILRESPTARPQICGFSSGTTRLPNVCCTASKREGNDYACPTPALPPEPPPVQSCQQFLDGNPREDGSSGPGSLARKMCRKHQEDLCALPLLQEYPPCPAAGRIADILEFPHMALLGYGDRDNIEYACGGSLISRDFILTAAHCARPAGQPVRWALLGATNRTSQEPKGNDTHQLLEISQTIVHPQYDLDGIKYHDIALLRLAKPAKVSIENVHPACLDTDVDQDNTGQEAVATGWGATSFDDEGSQSLIKVNLTVRELQFCRDNIELDATKLPRGLVDTQLCAGGGAHGRDTCQGDSGGPLQVRANPTNSVTCMYRIIGVVSFGPPCGLGKPGVYSKVAAYIDWIERIVWPTKSDGCSRTDSLDAGEVLIPNTGPGTVARGMCRSYHVEFCPSYYPYLTDVKPDLSLDSKCHHNKAEVDVRGMTGKLTTVTFRWGNTLHNLQHACNGALVSPRAVLTAGRCAKLGCLPIKKVILGHPAACSSAGHFAVESVLVHPEYRAGESYADLAVVILEKSVDLRHFLPMCLDTPGHNKLKGGRRALAATWNIIGEWEHVGFRRANDSLAVHTQEQCEAVLMGHEKIRGTLPRGYQPSLLCAGGLCTNETYAGDSGTPLTVRPHTLDTVNGKYHADYVAGVATSVTYCTARDVKGNHLPDLFTSVAKHVAWIESVVWPDQ